MRSPWLIRSLLMVAGAFFPLTLAPLYWWPVAIPVFALFAVAMESANTPRQAFWRTWFFAFGQFISGVSWVYVSIHDFGGTPAPLAALVAALFAAVLATVPALVFLLRHYLTGLTLTWLTLPVFWFIAEWTRSWLLTGFPWLYVGDAHLESWLSGWAPVIGSFGMSFLLVLSVTASIQALRRRNWLPLLILAVWPAGLWLQQQDWTQPSGSLVVSAVQGNIPQNMKWQDSMVGPTINLYFGETGKLWNSDLILWPETAITLVEENFRPYQEELAEIARQHQSAVITGIPYRYPYNHPYAGRYHNSILAMGTASGLYHKQKLVPFGEFVPFEEWLRGALPFMDLEMSSFLAGTPDQPLLKLDKNGQLVLIAPYICYEIAYPLLVAEMASQADLLVTISNDAWFGDSLGPKQHMGLARMRALETGRYLLRATNTGITALVDDRGHIVSRLPTNERASLTATAELRQGQTPFMQLGIWPLSGLSVLIILIAMIQQRRQRHRNDIRSF